MGILYDLYANLPRIQILKPILETVMLPAKDGRPAFTIHSQRAAMLTHDPDLGEMKVAMRLSTGRDGQEPHSAGIYLVAGKTFMVGERGDLLFRPYGLTLYRIPDETLSLLKDDEEN